MDLELDPRDELALIGLANLRLADNQPKGVLEYLEKVWQVSPEFLSCGIGWWSTTEGVSILE